MIGAAKFQHSPVLKRFLISLILGRLNSFNLLPCIYFLHIRCYTLEEIVILLFGILLLWQLLSSGLCICSLVLKEP